MHGTQYLTKKELPSIHKKDKMPPLRYLPVCKGHRHSFSYSRTASNSSYRFPAKASFDVFLFPFCKTSCHIFLCLLYDRNRRFSLKSIIHLHIVKVTAYSLDCVEYWTKTWVTAPITAPFWIMELPLTSVSSKGQKFRQITAICNSFLSIYLLFSTPLPLPVLLRFLMRGNLLHSADPELLYSLLPLFPLYTE